MPAALAGIFLTTERDAPLPTFTFHFMPKITYRVNRPVRSVNPGGDFSAKSVTLLPSYRVEGLASSELAALDALKDLERIPDATPVDTIHRIVELVRSGRLSLKCLVRLARHEPPRVRALVGAIGSHLGAGKTVARLKKSLNPLTTFALDVGDALPNAAEWQIR